MSRLSRSIRVEDILSIVFALGLALLGGVRAVLSEVRLDEGDFWDISYILSPLSLLIFLASVRYALGGGSGGAAATLRQIGGILRDWLPFLVFLLMYEAFRTRIWMVLLQDDVDAELLALDRTLFGETPAVWTDRLVQPLLTDVMTFAYFCHLLLPPIVAFVWYRRNHRMFREFLLAVLLAGLVASIGYILVPAVGPAVAFPELFINPLQSLLHGPLTEVLNAARAPRDVFPSLHVGLSTIVLWYGGKLSRGWFLFLLPLVLLNWMSTIYLRYHYLIDVFAGWLTAALVIWMASRLLRLEHSWRERSQVEAA